MIPTNDDEWTWGATLDFKSTIKKLKNLSIFAQIGSSETQIPIYCSEIENRGVLEDLIKSQIC
jgi:hypothetical protein